MGVAVDDIMPYPIEAARTIGLHPQAAFQRGFFAELVPNVRKLGLLDANGGYLPKKWREAERVEFEFADDTASDDHSHDAGAGDRAAGV